MSAGSAGIASRTTVASASFRRWLGNRDPFAFRRARIVCGETAASEGVHPAVAVTIQEASAEELEAFSRAIGRAPAEGMERRGRGCVCLIALSGTDPLGWVWINRTPEMMTEVHYVLDASRDPQGAYLFDGFVLPAYRGKGILRAILVACHAWAAVHGISRLYAAFLRENHASERALRATGFTTVVGDVSFLRVLGLQKTWLRLYEGSPMADVLSATPGPRPVSDPAQDPAGAPPRPASRRG